MYFGVGGPMWRGVGPILAGGLKLNCTILIPFQEFGMEKAKGSRPSQICQNFHRLVNHKTEIKVEPFTERVGQSITAPITERENVHNV